MKLSTRLSFAVGLLTAICVVLASGITGWLAQHDSSEALSTSLAERFRSVVSSRKTSLEQLVQNDSQLLRSLVNARMTQDAAWGFRNPFNSYRYEVPSIAEDELRTELSQWYQDAYQTEHAERAGGEVAPTDDWLANMSHEALLLQKYYMVDNEYAVDAMERMDDRGDGTIYGQQHSMYHGSYRDTMARFGFSDLLLVDANNFAVTFSTAKSPVFATSLRDGPFKDSTLAALIADLEASPRVDGKMSKFELNPYRFGAVTAYLAVPVYHWSQSPERPIAYLVAEVSAEHWAGQLSGSAENESLGLGETGETYLVDSNYVLLSEVAGRNTDLNQLVYDLRQEGVADATLHSITRKGRTAGELEINTHAVSQALLGNSGTEIETDYIGRRMFTTWTPIEVMGHRFALIAQQEVAEVQASLTQMRRNVWYSVILSALVLTVLSSIGARFLAMVVSGPLQRMRDKIRYASEEKDLRVHFPVERKDELGDISQSLNGLFALLNTTLNDINTATENTSNQAQLNAERARETRESVESQKNQIQSVGSSCDGVCRSLHSMADKLRETDTQTQLAKELAVDGGAQMRETVKGIEKLSTQVADSFSTLNDLRAAADNVFTMLDTIKSVSEQTNLLALNAAIEAARAGEHGRGFAVVADEVRRLSASTRTAASNIESQIQNLQSRVQEISIGLSVEQESALRCVIESKSAQQALEQISQQVSHVSDAMVELSQQSQREYLRVNTMRGGLETVVEAAVLSDATIYSLSESARDQLSQCERAAAATRTLKCSF
jgi:methyl-accepting chemotaxis protein